MKSIYKITKHAKPLILILLLVFLLPNITLSQGLGKRLRQGFNDDEAQEQLKQKLNKRANAGFGGGMQMRVWARALKLSEDQIRRMRQTMRASAENYISIERQAIEKRQQLERATFSESFNEENVKQLALEVAKLEGQMVVMRAKVQVQIRNILTQEQLKLYNELRFGIGKNTDQGGDVEKQPEPSVEQKN